MLFILLLYKSCAAFIRFSPSFFELTYMLLQSNCINNGLKQKKEKRKQPALYGKIKKAEIDR